MSGAVLHSLCFSRLSLFVILVVQQDAEVSSATAARLGMPGAMLYSLFLAAVIPCGAAGS
jgi:hypothetical protein